MTTPVASDEQPMPRAAQCARNSPSLTPILRHAPEKSTFRAGLPPVRALRAAESRDSLERVAAVAALSAPILRRASTAGQAVTAP